MQEFTRKYINFSSRTTGNHGVSSIWLYWNEVKVLYTFLGETQKK